MNRNTYNTVRRSIRDNGMIYTYQHATDTSDTDAVIVCIDLQNIVCKTDWLALRQQFKSTGDGAHAFKLTCQGKAYERLTSKQ